MHSSMSAGDEIPLSTYRLERSISRLCSVRCRVSVRVNLTYLLSRPLADSWVPLLPRRRLRGCPLRGNRWCKPVQFRGTSSRTTLFKNPLRASGGRALTARQKFKSGGRVQGRGLFRGRVLPPSPPNYLCWWVEGVEPSTKSCYGSALPTEIYPH